jgi:ParB family transcriptional regulator, chromosome partitioning protein
MASFKPGANPFDVPNTLFPSKEKIEQNEQSVSSPTTLPISKLKSFSKHPFKMYGDEKLQSLAESIKTHGVISPILVRPIDDDKYEYEIIAGHNRVQASRIAGIYEIPSTIKEMDNETATILMVDSNLEQRESILPSEKAFAYKYKLEAIKAQGKRTDLTSSQVGTKLPRGRADEVLASKDGESRNQIQRYIRLTNLAQSLLGKVDDRKLSFIPAVDLSYLTEKEQQHLFDILNREENFTVTGKQANMLKNMSQSKPLTYEDIDKIITDKVSNTVSLFKVSYKKVQDYFPKTVTPKEFEETLLKALDAWFVKEQEQSVDKGLER